jgi:hypothetical protein
MNFFAGSSKRSLALFTALALALVILNSIACDDEESSQQGLSTWAFELFERIPDGNYSMLGYANLEAFVNSDFGQLLLQFFPSYQDWSKRLGIKFENLERLAFVAYPPSKEEKYGAILMVLVGDVEEQAILDLPGVRDIQFELQELNGNRVYSMQEGLSFCVPEKGFMVFGSTRLVNSTLMMDSEDTETLAEGEGIEPFEDYFLKTDDFLVAIDGIDLIIESLREEYSLLSRFSLFKSGVVGVDVDKDARLRIQAVCDSPQNAERIASGIQGVVGLLSVLVENEPLSYSAESNFVKLDIQKLRDLIIMMLESVEAVSADEEVVIKATIPYDLIDYIATVTKEIVSSSEQSESNS